MSNFEAKDPLFIEKTKDSFARQEVMKTIGAELVLIEAGHVEIEFKFDKKLTQQHGFIHAGISSTVLDSACGYAALTLMPEHSAVLTIEFKINLLSPANGQKFMAIAKVKKPGRTITVADGELYSFVDNNRKLIATMTGTLMTMRDNES